MKRKHKSRKKEKFLVGIVILKSCYAFACTILLYSRLALFWKYYESACKILLVIVRKRMLDSDLVVTNACEMMLKKEINVNVVMFIHTYKYLLNCQK